MEVSSKGRMTLLSLSTSQIQIALSSEPEALRLPSGENPTDVIESWCPSRGPMTVLPLSTSQIRIVVSREPEIMRLPSGKNPTDVIKSWFHYTGHTPVVLLFT